MARASGMACHLVCNPVTRPSALLPNYITKLKTTLCLTQVGGFLSFNVLFPTEKPDIPRLMGYGTHDSLPKKTTLKYFDLDSTHPSPVLTSF